MVLHIYDSIVDPFGYCPIPVAIGTVNCGRSTALRIALGFVIFSRNSAVVNMQLLSSHTCPVGRDDQSHMHDIEQLLVAVFNQEPRDSSGSSASHDTSIQF